MKKIEVEKTYQYLNDQDNTVNRCQQKAARSVNPVSTLKLYSWRQPPQGKQHSRILGRSSKKGLTTIWGWNVGEEPSTSSTLAFSKSDTPPRSVMFAAGWKDDRKRSGKVRRN